MKEEKRKHPRIESLNLLAYKCLDREGRVVNQGMGRTLNVSEFGILLETYHPLDSEYILLVDIGIEEELVDLKGKLVHSQKNAEGKYESGIEFTQIDEKSRNVLKGYIEAFAKINP